MWLERVTLLLTILCVKGDVLVPDELVYETVNFKNQVRTTTLATGGSFYFAYVDYVYVKDENQLHSNVTLNKIRLEGDLVTKLCEFQFHVQSLSKNEVNPEIKVLRDGNVTILYEDELDGISSIRVNTLDMANCKVKNTDFVMRANLNRYNFIPYNDTFDFIVQSDILDCNGRYCVFTYNSRGNRVRDPLALLPEYELEYLKVFSVANDSSREGYFGATCEPGTEAPCTIFLVNPDGSYEKSVNHLVQNTGNTGQKIVFHRFVKNDELISFTATDELTKEYEQFHLVDKNLDLEKVSGYVFGPGHFLMSLGATKSGNIVWIHAPITDDRPGNFNIKKTDGKYRIGQNFIYNDPKDKLHLEHDPQYAFHDMQNKLCFEIHYPKSDSNSEFKPTWSIKCFSRTIFWH